MVLIKKIQNGLTWNGEEKFFTKELLENGYEIMDNIHISIELNNMVFCLKCDDTVIDQQGPFQTSQDLVNTLFT